MNQSDIPFNIKILNLTKEKLSGLRPVRSLDILEGATNNLHPDGLYSTETFGKVGSKRRMMAFSYIDIKVAVFHPVIYQRLMKMHAFYGDIIAGKEYAVWNEETKDFDRSNALDGQTGFAFFCSHWEEIEFKSTDSVERDETLTLLRKYKDNAFTDKIVVMPAGYRDLEYDNNRIRESEINSFYKRLLSTSNAIAGMVVKINPAAVDRARYNLQSTFNELYNYIEQLVKGKHKLYYDKWASRSTFNGTRNVITTMQDDAIVMHDKGGVKFNNTQVGIYQAAKCLLPVTQYHLREKILGKLFVSVDMPVKLINKKTLKAEDVRVRPEVFDYWASDEGVEKVINSMAIEANLHNPVVISDHYLALVYKDDAYFKVFHDIDDLPAGFDKNNVRPITLAELVYLSIHKEANKYPIFMTRYPILGIGSIYPSSIYLRTTVRAKRLMELGIDWEPLGEVSIAYQYPIEGKAFIQSLVPHPARLDLLGGDFDGDTGSGVAVYSDEAVSECNSFMQKKKAYVAPDGRAVASINTDTLSLLFHNLTVG